MPTDEDPLETFVKDRGLEPGNIDVTRRKPVMTPEGLPGTVRSIGVNIDGVETLIPTISNEGRIMSTEEAIAEYKKTGQHLGQFRSPEEATAFAKRLSAEEGKRIKGE